MSVVSGERKRDCLVSTREMAFRGEETKPTRTALCGPASEALRIHFNDLILAIQDPEIVACALYSVNIISSGVMSEVGLIAVQKKMMKLLAAVGDKLAIEPEKFTDLLVVLNNNSPSLGLVAQKLEETHAKLLSQPASTQVFQVGSSGMSTTAPRVEASLVPSL